VAQGGQYAPCKFAKLDCSRRLLSQWGFSSAHALKLGKDVTLLQQYIFKVYGWSTPSRISPLPPHLIGLVQLFQLLQKLAQMAEVISSRVCVKQLPNNVTEKSVREHFASHGDITDLKLLSTRCVKRVSLKFRVAHIHLCRSGRSRHMAFIGFKTPREADEVVAHFNKTFFGASKLVVEKAVPVRRNCLSCCALLKPSSAFVQIGSSSAPKSWSKHTKASGKHSGDADSDDEVDVADSGRLFVRNLPYSASESDLKQYFAKHGPISEVNLPTDGSDRSKGYAFVTYLIPEDAVKALSGADGDFFQGRILHVLPAKPAPGTGSGTADGESGTSSTGGGAVSGGSAFKSEQEAKRKERAVSGAEAPIWNALFLRQDTLVAALAARHNMSEGGILDKQSGNMAVRVALGETAIIAETKQFLMDNGVSLDVMEASLRGESPARSDTVLLVKNLPFEASLASLQELFGRYGALLRVVMPPTRAIALVEFNKAKQATLAFRALAYSKYMGVPLYLEKAPEGVLKPFEGGGASAVPAAGAQSGNGDAQGAGHASGDAEESTAASGGADDDGPVTGTGKSIFVKNLAFVTTEDGLREMFQSIGPVRSVRIPHRPNTGKRAMSLAPGAPPPTTISMGYGFVEYDDADSAKEAIKRLQSTSLDGHALQLKISSNAGSSNSSAPSRKRSREGVAAPGAGASKATPKIMVKNIAFQASKGDLRELFAAYGDLKSVRLPKRFDGRARGFAFVEYSSAKEAAAAVAALSATHLYGRHLVLEYAASDDVVQSQAALQAAAADDANVAAGGERKVKSKQRRLEE